MFCLLVFVRPGTSQAPYLDDDYTWFRKIQEVGFARSPTGRALFRVHTTHLPTEALLLPDHVFGAASLHTCVTKRLPIIVLGMN